MFSVVIDSNVFITEETLRVKKRSRKKRRQRERKRKNTNILFSSSPSPFFSISSIDIHWFITSFSLLLLLLLLLGRTTKTSNQMTCFFFQWSFWSMSEETTTTTTTGQLKRNESQKENSLYVEPIPKCYIGNGNNPELFVVVFLFFFSLISNLFF